MKNDGKVFVELVRDENLHLLLHLMTENVGQKAANASDAVGRTELHPGE